MRCRRLYHRLGSKHTFRKEAPLSTGSVLDLGFCSDFREGQTCHLSVDDQGTPWETCAVRLGNWRG